MRKFQVLLALIAVACLVLNTGWAFAGEGKTQGQPFLSLQQQIDELRAQIKAIQLTPGPQEPPGTACWDSNENGACDPRTEDINGDGKCTVQDCQAASNNDVIRVYDSSQSAQYLGIGVSSSQEIYIPSLSLFTRIGYDGIISYYANLMYETNDCSGDAFMPYTGAYSLSQEMGEYYTGLKVAPTMLQVLSTYNCTSVTSPADCTCIHYLSPFTVPSVPAVKIPKENIPFTLPVVIPLKYVLE